MRYFIDFERVILKGDLMGFEFLDQVVTDASRPPTFGG